MEQTAKTITIGGTKYPVTFNAKALMNFEEITDKCYFKCPFDKTTDRIALIMAAAKAFNPDTTLDIGDMLNVTELDDLQEIINAYNFIMTELVPEFFKIPKVVQEEEQQEQANVSKEEKESAKN